MITKSKTVLITGASRGIGRAVSVAFAQKGYHLLLICQNSKVALEELQRNLIATYQVECSIFVGDAGNEEFVSSIYKQFTTIDILINNAGIAHFGLLQDTSLNEWNQVFQTNLTSAFLFSKYAIPLMLQTGHGKIINLSSVWGMVGASYETAYCASKSALNGLTRALAKELAPSNIQVNALACGMIDTDMNQSLTLAEVAAIKENIPAGRLGSSDEVASMILQLAEAGDYLTGQIIGFDGGWI